MYKLRLQQEALGKIVRSSCYQLQGCLIGRTQASRTPAPRESAAKPRTQPTSLLTTPLSTARTRTILEHPRDSISQTLTDRYRKVARYLLGAAAQVGYSLPTLFVLSISFHTSFILPLRYLHFDAYKLAVTLPYMFVLGSAYDEVAAQYFTIRHSLIPTLCTCRSLAASVV